MYAAAALAIDYGILPWGKRATFRAIEKCMRLALETLETGRTISIGSAPDPRHIGETLAEHLARAKIVLVTPKKKVTKQQMRARRKADGFKINGKIYVRPDRLNRWIPNKPDAPR